jgi:hypothetical protein
MDEDKGDRDNNILPIDIWVEIVAGTPVLYGTIARLNRMYYGALRWQMDRFKTLSLRQVVEDNRSYWILPVGWVHGRMTTYYKGNVWWVRDYVDNKQNGKWTYYRADGTMWWTCEYADDQAHGEFLIYDTNGNIISTKRYIHGEFVE